MSLPPSPPISPSPSSESSLPSTMQALQILSRGFCTLTTVPLPRLRPGYILARTTAVAINPSDWKHVDFVHVGDPSGTRPGLEYAGVLVTLDQNLPESEKARLGPPGTRVCGIVNGSNARDKDSGAFAEYVLGKACFQMKIPDGLTDEEAAALPCGLAAVGQGLYQALKLPLPLSLPGITASPSSSEGTPPKPATGTATARYLARTTRHDAIFIYGGSTASGLLGIQFAVLSGLTVLTTCSPHNAAYLRSLGAACVIDYHLPPEVQRAELRAYLTTHKLRCWRAWDCISTAASASLCASVLEDRGAVVYASLLFVHPAVIKKLRPRAEVRTTIGYTIFGEVVEKETVLPPREEDYAFGRMWWRVAEEVVRKGLVRPARVLVDRSGGGLRGLLEGMRMCKMGEVSAGKLVCRMPGNGEGEGEDAGVASIEAWRVRVAVGEGLRGDGLCA